SPFLPSHPPRPFPYTTLFRSSLAGRRLDRPGVARPSAEQPAEEALLPRPAVVLEEAEQRPLDRVGVERPAGDVRGLPVAGAADRSEEHTSELQSRENLVCRLL